MDEKSCVTQCWTCSYTIESVDDLVTALRRHQEETGHNDWVGWGTMRYRLTPGCDDITLTVARPRAWKRQEVVR